MSGSHLGELALELLALVHHVGDRDGVDARLLHTVLGRSEVKVQRVRSTLYNLAALGYVERTAMSGHFRITANCKPVPAGTPMRPAPVNVPRPAPRAVPMPDLHTLEGTIGRLHTPNSIFDVERL